MTTLTRPQAKRVARVLDNIAARIRLARNSASTKRSWTEEERRAAISVFDSEIAACSTAAEALRGERELQR